MGIIVVLAVLLLASTGLEHAQGGDMDSEVMGSAKMGSGDMGSAKMGSGDMNSGVMGSAQMGSGDMNSGVMGLEASMKTSMTNRVKMSWLIRTFGDAGRLLC